MRCLLEFSNLVSVFILFFWRKVIHIRSPMGICYWTTSRRSSTIFTFITILRTIFTNHSWTLFILTISTFVHTCLNIIWCIHAAICSWTCSLIWICSWSLRTLVKYSLYITFVAYFTWTNTVEHLFCCTILWITMSINHFTLTITMVFRTCCTFHLLFIHKEIRWTFITLVFLRCSNSCRFRTFTTVFWTTKFMRTSCTILNCK